VRLPTELHPADRTGGVLYGWVTRQSAIAPAGRVRACQRAPVKPFENVTLDVLIETFAM
jgi:hypothetical protein